nr:secretin N-terminal domain-containing protein [Deinococcus sp. YIM 77859]
MRIPTLTLLLSLSAPSLAQSPSVTFTPLPSAPAPTVQLPSTAELNKTVSLTVPLGGLTLEQALTGIGRAAGLSVLTQGLPSVTIRDSIAPMPARQAIATLINLYAPNTTAAVMGKLLLVGTPGAIARVQGRLIPPGNAPTQGTYRILNLPGFTAAHLERVTGLTPRVRTALFDDGIVLLSGAPADVAEAEQFFLSLPTPKTPEVPGAPAAPAPVTRTYTVTGDSAAIAAAVRDVTGAAVTAVGGTLVVKGTEGQQADVRAILAALPPVKPPVPTPTPAQDVNPVSRRTYVTPVPEADATYLRALFGDITVIPLTEQGVVVVEARASRHTDVTAALKDTAARRAERVTTYYPVMTGKAADLIATLRREAPDAEINTVDGRNMLAIRAAPAEQVRLSELLRTLQSGPVLNAQVPTEIITRSVKLGYADASLMAADLGRLSLGASGTHESAAGREAGTGTATTEGGKPAGNVTIIADARTNSLLLTGPRAQVLDMVSAINLIDVPVPSVRVRLRVEQLSASDAQNLGVNWRLGLGGVSVGQQGGTLSVGYAPSLSPASVSGSASLRRGRVGSRRKRPARASGGRRSQPLEGPR